MYAGRDMTELGMISKKKWKDTELAYFHHSLQQMVPYLNAEGQTIHREIIEEIEARGGLKRQETDDLIEQDGHHRLGNSVLPNGSRLD